MNIARVFEGMNENKDSLLQRLDVFSEELDLQPGDENIFITPDQETLALYINNFLHYSVSSGVHLARVRKVKSQISSKLDKLFDDEYVRITDECIAGKNSSKFDVTYRTGKARQVPKYKELSKLLCDVTELEGWLTAVRDALQMKAHVLPTMFKVDRLNY